MCVWAVWRNAEVWWLLLLDWWELTVGEEGVLPFSEDLQDKLSFSSVFNILVVCLSLEDFSAFILNTPCFLWCICCRERSHLLHVWCTTAVKYPLFFPSYANNWSGDKEVSKRRNISLHLRTSLEKGCYSCTRPTDRRDVQESQNTSVFSKIPIKPKISR